jgi:hypothetical protein
LPHGTVAAIEGARRWEIEPVQVACACEAAVGAGDSIATATLGRADRAAIILLRFLVALPPDSDVLEAYVLLDRAADIEADPIAVSLHAERIESSWSGASVSWVGRPRLRNTGAPWTRAFPWGGQTVRIDVRDLVTGRRQGAREDTGLGLAIVSLGSSPTGLVFALESGRHGRGPRLELYVK